MIALRLPSRTAPAVFSRLALATMAAAALAACHKQPPPPPGPPVVGVVTIKTQPVTRTTELPGRTDPYLTSDVRPQVAGILRSRLFVEGANVRAGQVLYEIDPAPYQAALDQAKGTLASAQANLVTMRLQAQRYADLVKINAVSRQDNDNAQATYGQALATVQSDRAAVESAAINLGYTKVRAPISGRIGRSVVTPGALLGADQTTALATIQALDPIYVDVSQSTDALIKLRHELSGGQLDNPDSTKVKLQIADGTTYPYEGALKFSEVTVDQTTGTVTLRALFQNPKAELLPGMFVREQIVEGIDPNGILAPQHGVSHNEKGEAVALIVGADNKVQSRTLKTIGALGPDWIVTEGLKPGDRLIVEGLLIAKPGMTVKPVPASQPSGAPQTGSGPGGGGAQADGGPPNGSTSSGGAT